jgi:hypothetical protein
MAGRSTVSIGRSSTACITLRFVSRNEIEGWITVAVEVAVDVWRGEYHGDFYPGELPSFGRELAKIHQSLFGVTRFTPVEPSLSLTFTGDGRGHFVVEGKAEKLSSPSGTYLHFQFDLDQTDLPPIISALQGFEN